MFADKFQSRRAWLIGAVVAALLIALASWELLISPKLDSADSLTSQAADVDTQNSLQIAKNAKLKQQYEGIGSLRTKLGDEAKLLPAVGGLPQFTDELTGLAKSAGVDLTSVTVSGITPATSTATVATPAVTDPSASSQTSSSAPPSSAGSAMQIAISISASGKYSQQVIFLKSISRGSRKALVGTVQLGLSQSSTVSSVDGQTTMTAQLTIFSAPITSDQATQLEKLISGH